MIEEQLRARIKQLEKEAKVNKSALDDGLCADSYEERVIEFEAARNEAMESYYGARPQLFRTREKDCLFEAGFRMAWDKKPST